MEINITLYKRHIVNDVAAECNLIGRTLETAGNAEEDKSFSALKELAGYIKSPSDNETKPVVARAMSEGFNAVKEACQRFLIMGRDTDDNRLESIFEENQTVITEEAANFCDPDNFDAGNTQENNCYTVGLLPFVKGITYKIAIDRSQANFVSSLGSAAGTFRLYVGNSLVTEFPAVGNDTVVAEWEATQTASLNVYLAMNDVNPELLAVAAGSVLPFTFQWNDFGEYKLDLDIDNFNTGVTSTVTSYAHRLIVDHVMAAILKNQQQEGYTKYIKTEEDTRDKLVKALQARRSFGRYTHDWK